MRARRSAAEQSDELAAKDKLIPISDTARAQSRSVPSAFALNTCGISSPPPVQHENLEGACTGRRPGHLLFFLVRRRKCIADEAINRAFNSILIMPPFRLQEPSINECVNLCYV